MKKYLLSLFLLVSIAASAQKTLNDYKYVIVPLKYEFFKEENKYRLNTITKFNLTKMGFEPFYENENLPSEANDRCNRLFVNVESDGSFLATKLTVVFRDCDNKVVYTSEPGKSKSKEYKISYPEALNNAFENLYSFGYAYNGTIASSKPITNEPKKSEAPVSSAQIDETKDYLFAQPIINGFQLIDKTPKIVYKIYKTSQPDYFTVQGDGIVGALLKKNGEWILEYYKDGKPVSEKLLIKF